MPRALRAAAAANPRAQRAVTTAAEDPIVQDDKARAANRHERRAEPTPSPAPAAMLGRALWWAPRSNMFLAACTGADTFFAGSERQNKTGVFASYSK